MYFLKNLMFCLTAMLFLSQPVLAVDLNNDAVDENVVAYDSNGDGHFDNPIANSLAVAATTNRADILVVDADRRNAFFGFYRFSQMTSPGWAILQDTIDWAIGPHVPERTRIIHFTYNGTLDHTIVQEEDSAVLNDYLLARGYSVEVHHQSDKDSLPASYYTSFNLAIYSNSYPRSVAQILSANIPYITNSSGETDELGIGTGINTFHQYTDSYYVLDNSHPITTPYPLGLLNFSAPMWSDGIHASGTGIPLISGVLANPTVTIFPPDSVFTDTTRFDITLMFNPDGGTVVNNSILFDGVDVTAGFSGCAIPGTMAGGEMSFRCSNVQASGMGLGVHQFTVSFDLDNGTSTSQTVVWEVLDTTE